jgi:mono/diheme cytochrome c family protein
MFVFGTALHSSILGALLTFAPVPWYPVYATTTWAWGLAAIEDQQLGGLVMWIPAGIVYTAAGLGFVAAWLQQSERRDASLRSTRVVAVLLAASAAASSTSCGPSDAVVAAELTGGTPQRGRQLISYYGCGSCHEIPGVHGADGLVGPSLRRIAIRSYIAGMLPNTPANMTRWIREPQRVDEHTVMPDMHVTPDDVRHIAAYLYTLR